MNKKFLSAILFGALMVTSTGTFVSCKDYDEDIENLQSQINKLATKDELSSQISTLQAALNAAAANAATAIAKAEGAEKAAAEAEAAAIAAVQEELAAAKAELEEMVGAGLGTNTEALAAMNETVKAVEAKVTALVGEVSAMVTSVELFELYSTNSRTLWVDRIVEKDAVFGDKTPIKADETITFNAGTVHAVESDMLVVRVSPTNAVLAPENISLIDSDGNNLNEYLEVANVYPYSAKNDLFYNNGYVVSRAAETNKSGLWCVTFKLKENADLKKFEKAIVAKVDEGTTQDVVWMNNFAFAVKNTAVEEGAAERNVVSGFGVRFRTSNVGVNNQLDFYANNENVWNIRNRWYRTEAGWNSAVELVQELQWKSTPAVAPIVEGDKINVEFKVVNKQLTNYFDNRQYANLLPVVMGKPIQIRINAYKDGDKWIDGQKIAGFYVTLDKANALESAPSELNAWNSYEYENVGTDKQAAKMFKGNTGAITVKSLNNVLGDVIGFRVYAVNLDGTLMDPDGRAFYVSVGDAAAETQIVSATIAPKSTADNYVYVELTETQKAVIASLEANKTDWSWNADVNNPTMKAQQVEDPTFTVTFTKDKKGNAPTKASEYNYAKFTMDAAVDQYINDKAYKMTMTYYKSMNGTNHELGKVVYDLTKTMTKEFPAAFAFRPKQEVADGTGKFVAYMIPENGYDTASDYGVKDLNNVFYGLDDNYSFVFATSAKNAKDEIVSTGAVLATPAAANYYELKVAKEFINNETWHAVTVKYLYRGVSTYYDEENKVYVVGEDWPVAYANSIEAKYACWEDASAFVWGTYKSGTSVLSHKPALQWTATAVGEEANLSDIESTNSYNNDFFGLDLESLVNTNGWLTISDMKLTVGEQVNPYFAPEKDGSKIKFVQVSQQVDAAPVADHEETLVITVVDAYGHKTVINLAVTVKAPTKK